MTDSVFLPYIIKEGVLDGIKPYLCQAMKDIINDKNKSVFKAQVSSSLKRLYDSALAEASEQFLELTDPTSNIYKDTVEKAFFTTFYKNKNKINARIKKLKSDIEKSKEEEKNIPQAVAFPAAAVTGFPVASVEGVLATEGENQPPVQKAVPIEEKETAEIKDKIDKETMQKKKAELDKISLEKQKEAILREGEISGKQHEDYLKKEKAKARQNLEKRKPSLAKNGGSRHKKTRRAIRQNWRRTRTHQT